MTKQERKGKIVIVLAGDFRQFQDFLLKKGVPPSGIDEVGNRYIYGDRVEKLYGFEASDFQVIGTFWERSDAGELHEIAMSRIRQIK